MFSVILNHWSFLLSKGILSKKLNLSRKKDGFKTNSYQNLHKNFEDLELIRFLNFKSLDQFTL